MTTYTALTIMPGEDAAYALSEALEQLDPEPIGTGVFEIEDGSGLWEVAAYMTDRPDADHVILEMTCGKGGYVRSIARDLGEKLGCLAHVVTLRRVWSGPFDATDGLTLDQIDAMARTPELDAHIKPLEIGLVDLPELRCTAEGAARLRNGNPGMVLMAGDVDYGDEAWASLDGQAIAVGTYKAGELYPSRVFNRS